MGPKQMCRVAGATSGKIIVGLIAALALSGFGVRTASAEVGLKLVADGFVAPIFLTTPGDGTGRRFLGEQLGTVHILDTAGNVLPKPFLDIRAQIVELRKGFDERGLWALAFHPQYAENGRFFVTYSARRRADSPFGGKTAHTWRLSEFRALAGDPNTADSTSERVLLELDWVNRKHNGGGLAFGPDGRLYVGVGDGGGVHGVPDVHYPPRAKDADSNAPIMEDPFKLPAHFHHYDDYAQDTQRLNGKILRLDVDADALPYGIPKTNVFADGARGRPEIYAWGFRNPFRLAFDRAGNGDLFVNGVAESFWETVYLVDGPGNYGWAIREGTHCFDRARIFDPPADCPRVGPLGERIHDPIVEYANQAVLRPESKVSVKPLGTASVGGYIYRGTALPELRGKFVLGDFSVSFMQPSGQLLLATPTQVWRAPWKLERLVQLDVRVHSLGEDADGELYVLTTAYGIPVGTSGKVWKVVAKP